MNDPTIVVEGQGRLRIEPDAAVVEATVAVLNLSYAAANTEAHRLTNLLREAIVPLGFARTDFKTTQFDVKRETEYIANSQRAHFVGYRARHTVELRLPLDKERLNRLVEACLASGAHAEINVRFTVSEPEAARDRLLAAAVENAQQRAAVIAGSAGVKLGDIVQIHYGATEVRFRSDSLELHESGPSAPEIEAGDFVAEERVQITWKIGMK